MLRNCLLLFSVMLLFGCSSDNDSQPDKLQLNLVTGITARQNFDDAIYVLGNPNTRTNNMVTIYPNPAVESLYMQADSPITDVWIVPAVARKIYQDQDYAALLNANTYTETFLSNNSSGALHGQTNSSLHLDVSGMAVGYYRVFMKVNGSIYCDNFYKYDNQQDTAAQWTRLVDFWGD